MITDIEIKKVVDSIVIAQNSTINFQDTMLIKMQTSLQKCDLDRYSLADRVDELLTENLKDNALLKKARRENRWLKLGAGILTGLIVVKEIKK